MEKIKVKLNNLQLKIKEIPKSFEDLIKIITQ